MPFTIVKLQNTVSSKVLFYSWHGDILKDRWIFNTQWKIMWCYMQYLPDLFSMIPTLYLEMLINQFHGINLYGLSGM